MCCVVFKPVGRLFATASAALVTASFFVAATIFMVSTTAATACQVLDQVLYFLLGSLAVFDHGTDAVEDFAGEGVVGIESDAIVFHFLDLGHEVVILVVHQGDHGVFVDMLAIELAIDGEDFAPNFVNASGFVGSESHAKEVLNSAKQPITNEDKTTLNAKL